MNNSNIVSEKLLINIGFKYNALLFIVDQIFRLVVLYLYLRFEFYAYYFLLVQLALIVLLSYFNKHYKKKLLKKYRLLLNPIYSSEKAEIEIKENIPSKLMTFQLFLGYAFTFWFLYYVFDNHFWYNYLVIVLTSFGGMVAFILPLGFSALYRTKLGATFLQVESIKTILQNGIETVVKNDVTPKYPALFLGGLGLDPDPIEFDMVDLNDTRIAKLESELKSITYKSEAWMLESVFLGGLAFSGFLTVASANILGRETETFKNFISHIGDYLQTCSLNNLSFWYANIENHFRREDLFILIMLLCLASSVFFLLILTLRLRLNNLSLHLDHIFRVLTIFNAKEEEIFNNHLDLERYPNQVARFEKIQRKIDLALIDAENLLVKIRPVSIMMNIYRMIAIILFYIVLIISGFYFKPIVAVAIMALALFTVVYRKIETYISIDEIRKRVRRH